MKKYNQHVEDMPGNGGELARHLVEKFQLNDVQVESIEYESDHYDLNAKKSVCLKLIIRENHLQQSR